MPGPPVTQATSLGAAMAAPVAQNVAKFDPEAGQPVAKMKGKTCMPYKAGLLTAVLMSDVQAS